MEMGQMEMNTNTHAYRDYQMSRVSMKYFSPRNRVKGDNSDHYDDLVLAYKHLREVADDPDALMIAEARKGLQQAASKALVREDGLFDIALADAFASETGCVVKLLPPEEEEYYTGHIRSRYGEVFFD